MRHGIVWILLLAFALRAVTALGVHLWLQKSGRDFLVPGDAEGYWELAQKMARGEAFEIYSPPRRVMRMPGFPALLALAIKLGGGLALARALVTLCGVAACGLVYLLGRELIDARAGRTAALLAALSPLLTGFGVLLLSETAFAMLLVASLLAMAYLARRWSRSSRSLMEQQPRPRVGLALLTGVLIALANYVRPSWMLAAPGFCVLHLWFAWRRSSRDESIAAMESPAKSTVLVRNAALECALLFLGLLVTLSPWTYRNWQLTGHPIMTTLWVGPSLYDGLNAEATGDSNMTFFDRENLMRSMSEYEMDREYRTRAWRFAGEHPGRAAQLGLIKLGRFWSPWPNAEQFRHWSLCLIVGGFTIPMFLLAARGAWLRRFDARCLILTLGPVLYFSAIHTLFVGSVRYRLPAEYALLVLSAAGLLAMVDRWRNRNVITVPLNQTGGALC